jgi:hypothetical protein
MGTCRFRGCAAAIALLLAGCEMTTLEHTPSGAHGVSAVQFPDIPVPSGMTMREHEHRSFSVQAGSNYRFAEFVYEGPLAVTEVGAYMAERMPQHAWEQVARENPVPDVQILKFRRGRDHAECNIQRDEATTTMRVVVQTRIEPKG